MVKLFKVTIKKSPPGTSLPISLTFNDPHIQFIIANPYNFKIYNNINFCVVQQCLFSNHCNK
ncbi:hypothetical protein GCM10008907_11220 [Clostridium sartagoforme]